MATYELQGGEIYASLSLGGGQIFASPSLGGGEIYAGGGGGNLQPSKSVSYTPTESAQSATVTPDFGYDGMEEVSVSVGAISSTYVGSDIPLCDSSDVATTITDTNLIRAHSVIVAGGYYENPVSLLNPFGTATFAPVGTPYVDPSTGDLTVQFKADTAGMAYTKSSYSITDEGAFNVKGAQTYTPGTTDQTIGSGYLLTGNQTILGDANLLPENIKKDVTIFGKVGTYEGGGSGTPTVTALSAVYTQSGTVDIGDDFSVLYPDLVVTATISNSLTIEVAPTDYTLSGSFTVGTSAITVSYGGLTTTFNVTVTKYWDYYWDYTDGVMPPDWTPATSGDGTCTLSNDGVELYSGTGWSRLTYVNDTTTSGTLEVIFSVNNINTDNGARICVSDGTNGMQTCTSTGYNNYSNASYIKLLDNTANSNKTHVCAINTGADYKVRIMYVSNSKVGAVTVNGTTILQGYKCNNILYATYTRIWSQGTGGTVLVKRIRYKDN